VPNGLPIGPGRCVDGRQQLPAVRFSQASADTDPMPVASHRASGGLHAVLRQSRNGPALSRHHGILTIDRGEVYSALNQAGPGNDINVGSSGSQKAPTWSPASLVAIRANASQAASRRSSRPRPLAPMLRPEFGLPFVRPDRLARFGSLFRLGLRSGWGPALSSGHSAPGATVSVAVASSPSDG
jgi:hypothetical protein